MFDTSVPVGNNNSPDSIRPIMVNGAYDLQNLSVMSYNNLMQNYSLNQVTDLGYN